MSQATVVGSWSSLTAPRGVVWRDFVSGLGSVLKLALALVGVVTLSLAVFAISHPEIRRSMTEFVEGSRVMLFGAPSSAVDESQSDAIAANEAPPAADETRPDVSSAAKLPADQRAATDYLARKYRLAPDAIAVFVAEAFRTGQDLKLDPLLLLAVMSIESAMNPFAQSPVGAQGLMQVMPGVHASRFAEFGGPHAALHPVANIRVGSEILKEYVQRFGSVEEGLRAYVGSALQEHDNGYGSKVLSERARLESIVKRVAHRAPALRPVAAAAETKAVSAQPGI